MVAQTPSLFPPEVCHMPHTWNSISGEVHDHHLVDQNTQRVNKLTLFLEQNNVHIFFKKNVFFKPLKSIVILHKKLTRKRVTTDFMYCMDLLKRVNESVTSY